MICLISPSMDAAFNLAAEEYFLKNFQEDVFILYRNKDSVIVGKHQNLPAEINIAFTWNNNIPVYRRLSGGGTVFHDESNLNFTFICSGEKDKQVDFRKYTAPVISALHELGVNAVFSGRNNLTINGKKISGNAEHVWKNRVLHHGTLLFDSNLEKLNAVLSKDRGKYKDKAVKSIPAIVTNIKEHLEKEMTVEEFEKSMFNHIRQEFISTSKFVLKSDDLDKINEIRTEKFISWEWNYSNSPNYRFENKLIINKAVLKLKMDVEKGVIKKCELKGDLLSQKLINHFMMEIVNLRHHPETVNYFIGKMLFMKADSDITTERAFNFMF